VVSKDIEKITALLTFQVSLIFSIITVYYLHCFIQGLKHLHSNIRLCILQSVFMDSRMLCSLFSFLTFLHHFLFLHVRKTTVATRQFLSSRQ